MTVKELADLCGSYKTAVRRTLDRLDLNDRLTRDESGAIQIPDDVAELVINQLRTTSDAPEAPETEPTGNSDTVTLSLVEMLRGQLEAQNAIIQHQQETIATLTQALSNAQLLTAGTLQTLNQITAPEPTQTDTAETVTEDTDTDKNNGGVSRHTLKTETPPDRPEQPPAEPEKRAANTPPPAETPRKTPLGSLWGLLKRR